MGHYPVHFHMAQTTPSNTYVKDSSVNESMTRWMVVHATNGVTFARNVGWKSIGHGFYIEDGSEIDNKFQTNIGIYARPAIDEATVNPRKVPGILAADRITLDDNVPFHTDVDHPTAFWIMNGWNDFEYNVAVGAGTCGTCFWLLPGANSGMSRSEPMVRNFKGYAALQGSQVVTTVPMVDNPLGRAGLTPLRKFYGNSCTAAMNSLNTVGNAAACQGSGGLGNPSIPPVRNPFNLPRPCDQTNPPIRDAQDRIIGYVSYACANEANKEADDYYPKVTGVRNATLCDETKENCRNAPPCDRGHLDKCAVTVVDHYTSSFHMGAETNFGAIWLRGPGWFLVTNSALTDAQNAGLSIVSGGGYTESDVNQGRWALVRKTVFVGATQDPAKPDASGFASPFGPFNPKGVAIVEGQTCSDSHCVSAPDGLTVPVNNFAMNQRMFNIYDGPTYQDSNAYLDIKRLPITDCQGTVNGGNCKSKTLAGRVLGVPLDSSLGCYMPNAAIAWKQPNGFYYPPAFHSANLYFGVGTVDIRHFVIEPIFEPGTYKTKVNGPDGVKAKYCNWNEGMFTGYTDVDRQTELSDDDGSLTGYQKTVSVNNDAFFNAPTEEVECESEATAKTSPYDYVTSVVYPGCAITGTCCPPGETCREPDMPNWFWAEPCSNETCYGVPMYRQLVTKAEKAKEERPFIKMAGQSTRQRSTLTPNNGKFYVDTTVSYAKQKAASRYINEFREGEKYYLFLLFAKTGYHADVSDLRRREFQPGRRRTALGDEGRRQGRPLQGRQGAELAHGMDEEVRRQGRPRSHDQHGEIRGLRQQLQGCVREHLPAGKLLLVVAELRAGNGRDLRLQREQPVRQAVQRPQQRGRERVRLGTEGHRLPARRLLRVRLQDGEDDLRHHQAARNGHLPGGIAVVQGLHACRQWRGAVLHAEAEVRDRAPPLSVGGGEAESDGVRRRLVADASSGLRSACDVNGLALVPGVARARTPAPRRRR